MIAPNDKNRDPQKLMGDSGHSRADAKLISRAMRHKWKIPETLYETLPVDVQAIFDDTTEGSRERLRAAELLIKMHGQNQDMEPSEINVNVSADERRTQALSVVRGLLDQPATGAN